MEALDVSMNNCVSFIPLATPIPQGPQARVAQRYPPRWGSLEMHGSDNLWIQTNPSDSMFIPPLQTILVETTWEFSPASGQSGMLLIDKLYIYL